jgi:hypothetical protein
VEKLPRHENGCLGHEQTKRGRIRFRPLLPLALITTLAATQAVEAAPAHFWLSTSNSSSSGPEAPNIPGEVGATQYVYIWAKPGTFDSGGSKRMQNISLNLVSSDPLVDFLDNAITVFNPANRFQYVRDSFSSQPVTSDESEETVLDDYPDVIRNIQGYSFNTGAYTGFGGDGQFVNSPSVYDESTGYKTYTYTFAQSGTYRIGFGVVDEGDRIGESALLVDDVALASVNNSSLPDGFEAGLGKWLTTGDVSTKNAGFGEIPPQGSQQALLTSSEIGNVSDAQIESFLALNPASLDGLGNGDAMTGSAMKLNQTVTANAGDRLTFKYNFLTNENTPSSYNDFAFLSVTGSGVSNLFELADTGGSASPADQSWLIASVGFRPVREGTTNFFLQIGTNGMNHVGEGTAGTSVLFGTDTSAGATYNAGNANHRNETLPADSADLILNVSESGTATPGDYNSNNGVDAADYVVWRKSGLGLLADGSGPSGSPDGVVNEHDYTFWRARFGTTGAGSSQSAESSFAVPEPTLIAYVVSVFIPPVLRRRPN